MPRERTLSNLSTTAEPGGHTLREYCKTAEELKEILSGEDKYLEDGDHLNLGRVFLILSIPAVGNSGSLSDDNHNFHELKLHIPVFNTLFMPQLLPGNVSEDGSLDGSKLWSFLSDFMGLDDRKRHDRMPIFHEKMNKNNCYTPKNRQTKSSYSDKSSTSAAATISG